MSNRQRERGENGEKLTLSLSLVVVLKWRFGNDFNE